MIIICCSKNRSCFSHVLNIPCVIFSGSLHNFPDPHGHPNDLKALVTDLVVGQVEYCNGLVDPKGISQGLEGWKNQPTNRVFQMPNLCRGFPLHILTHPIFAWHAALESKKKSQHHWESEWIGWPSPTPNAQELYHADTCCTCWHHFSYLRHHPCHAFKPSSPIWLSPR